MIREIEKKDLSQLIKIWNEYYDLLTSSKTKHTIDSINKWFESRRGGGFEYFGYFNKDKLTGFVIIENRLNIIWLKFIAVEKTKKGKGIASKLIKYIISIHKNKIIKTEVLEENKTVLKFFEKNKFQIEKYDENEKQFILKHIF